MVTVAKLVKMLCIPNKVTLQNHEYVMYFVLLPNLVIVRHKRTKCGNITNKRNEYIIGGNNFKIMKSQFHKIQRINCQIEILPCRTYFLSFSNAQKYILCATIVQQKCCT